MAKIVANPMPHHTGAALVKIPFSFAELPSKFKEKNINN